MRTSTKQHGVAGLAGLTGPLCFLCLALAACTCVEYTEATDHFSYAMSIKRADPARFKAEMEAALVLYQAAMTECRQSDLDQVQTLSMITRCLLELDRFEDAEKIVYEMGEAIDKRFGQTGFTGDRLAIDLYRAQYLVFVGRRALQGIQEASTDSYSEMKLHLARPYYEEALRLYRAHQTTDDPEIARYMVLKDGQAQLELARGYIMPKTPSAKNNYKSARELLASTHEKIRKHSGPPLEAEFEKLRPQVAKDLDWVEEAIRKN